MAEIDISKMSIAHIEGKILRVFDNQAECLKFANLCVDEVKSDSFYSFVASQERRAVKDWVRTR